MNLDKLTMDELISLRNKIEYKINSYEDGYLYICSVRQFGSVWEERPSSATLAPLLTVKFTPNNAWLPSGYANANSCISKELIKSTIVLS